MTGFRRPTPAQQRDLSKATGGEPEAVRIWLLGDFRVSVGASRSIGDDGWRLRKAGNLVKLLALAGDHRLHREQTTGLLWPDLDSQAAANNLHHALYVARRTLEPTSPAGAVHNYLQLRDERLALCPDGPLWVDVGAFEEAASTARHGREAAAYNAALDLYSGELLPQDRYEPWAEQRRVELRELYLSLLVELAALYEERGEYEPAIEALSRAVAEEPAREEAHAGLMRLYALSGRSREALGQYERLRGALFEELDAEPDSTSTRLQQEIWTGAFPPDRLSSSPSGGVLSATYSAGNNLPIVRTSFVGRERETVEVRRLLAMTELLTLTGSGGSGKTRLALEVAGGLASAYPQGVWLVEFAPLSDAGLVSQAVARALDMPEMPGRSTEDTLAAHLQTRNLLLVLDNCEHLVDAVARLTETLLGSCPRLRVLATSREPLGVGGEALWTVPPLSLPDSEGMSSVRALAGAEAVRLLVDRARLRMPGFELTGENAEAVGRICRKLDGMPLAIELAAARMGALSVDQISGRLDDSLQLLTGGARTVEPRQRTLRATLDWSHDLLSEPEQALFRRLSVFAGGWTLEAAEEVCSGEGMDRGAMFDLLARLVDKSLVVAEPPSKAAADLRYRMLEPVGQYAREKLEDSGEVERFRRRHAEYYLAFAEETDEGHAEVVDVREWRSTAWLGRMEGEHDNLRAALTWSLGEDVETEQRRAELGLRMAVALFPFWHVHQTEGRLYLEKAACLRGDPTTIRWKARALHGASWLTSLRGDHRAATMFAEETVTISREIGDTEGIASGLTQLGMQAVLGQRDEIPLPVVLDELMQIKPALRNRTTLGYLLVLEGLVALAGADLDRSETLHEDALDLFRELRDAMGMVACLIHLAGIALARADHEKVTPLMREALSLGIETKNYSANQICLYGLACVAAHRAQPVRAARLWGAVEGMQASLGLHLTPYTYAVTGYEALLASTRSQVEEKVWSQAWAEGKAMPLERTFEYALSGQEAPEHSAPEAERPAHERPERLTRREQEVALLVERGLTNRRISSDLSISERTVENHVRNILKKLGFSSRAQIAAWIAHQR